MIKKKISEQLRITIGNLMYEQQLALTAGNDYQYEKIQTQIDNARCKLKLIEDQMPGCDNEDEDDQD